MPSEEGSCGFKHVSRAVRLFNNGEFLVHESPGKSFAAFLNPVQKSVAFGPESLDVLRVVVVDELPKLTLFVREARKLGIHLFTMIDERHVADRVRRSLKR